jgi:transposase-like protein
MSGDVHVRICERLGVRLPRATREEAALKLLFLALRQAAKKWTMPTHHWREALNHFTILWPERMPALERSTQ